MILIEILGSLFEIIKSLNSFINFLIYELLTKGGKMSWLWPVSNIIIAGLGIFFTWKARTSTYRGILYSKQLDCFFEILEELHKLWLQIRSEDSGTVSNLFGKNLLHLEKDFIVKAMKWKIILPITIADEVENIINIISKNQEELKKDSSLLDNAMEKLHKAAFKDFGIGRLYKETSSLIEEYGTLK